jgi:hypothetical protein
MINPAEINLDNLPALPLDDIINSGVIFPLFSPLRLSSNQAQIDFRYRRSFIENVLNGF